MQKIILFLFFISFSGALVGQEIDSNDMPDIFYDDNIEINKLFETFITSQELLINKPFVNFSVGASKSFLPTKLDVKNLPRTNNFIFEYGFLRLDTNTLFPKMINYSSEYLYLETNTNTFGFVRKSSSDLYDNQFNFGVGMRSGLGYQIGNDKELYLLHSSAFLWSYFDYDSYSPSKFFLSFDDNYKFGWRSAAGLELRLNKYLLLGLSYEHNNLYSGFEFDKWSGSWLVDNILQRWIDVLDPILIKEVGYNYPLLKFIYKNTVSIVLSEFRNNTQYYPFNSDYSLLQRKFNLNFKLIF